MPGQAAERAQRWAWPVAIAYGVPTCLHLPNGQRVLLDEDGDGRLLLHPDETEGARCGPGCVEVSDTPEVPQVRRRRQLQPA